MKIGFEKLRYLPFLDGRVKKKTHRFNLAEKLSLLDFCIRMTAYLLYTTATLMGRSPNLWPKLLLEKLAKQVSCRFHCLPINKVD